MPGLINRHTRNPLPLHNCRITGCVNGYSAGITAYLTYCNDEDHLVDGLYVMPTTEFSTVVAFEAQVYGRNYTASIREKSKCECVLSETPSITSGHMCLNQGKFVINEFDETRVFAATVGTIPPFGTVTLLISVVFELEITKDGALLFKLPSVFTPRFSPPILPDQTSLISFSYTGPDERAHANSLGSLLEIATDIPLNTIKYEFEFQLEIKAPGLLSGVSSSTHSIRVDADPLAVDASDVFVTLAEPHDFKKDFRMMIYLAKPHEPSVVIELGDMTGTEYVEFLKTTEDFSNLDNKEDKTIDKDRVTKLRNRLHRDIMHVPVIMLNYSPDFRELEDTLNKKFEVPSEFIFVIDRSGSMSGANIANARETLMLFMKSLPMTCQFNIIGFGSSFKPLFECSRPYTQVTISECSQYITKMKADMGGTNLFSPLEWIYKKPICRGFPRHVFVLTDGTVNNVQQVIELVKNNSHNTRVFSFGIGPRVSYGLVNGIAEAGRGAAEFIGTDERMQSKVISSVKKALQPFISEVTIEWSLPAGLQVSQSFTETPTLMPGERLIIYGILYDTCAVTRQSEETTSAPKRSPYNEKVSSKDICSYDEVTNVNNNNVDELKPVPQVNHLDSSALVALRQKLSRDESESDKNEVEEIVDDQVQQRYFDILSRSGRALSNPETAFDSALLRKLLDSLAEEQRAKAVRKEERRAKYRERLTNNNGPRRKISDIVLAPFSSEWDNLLQGLEPSPCDSLFRFSWDEDGLLPLKEGGKEGVAVLRGLFCGRPFHCQIYFDLSSIIDGSPRSLNEEEFFDDTVHRLAAKSCIQAVESLYYQTANNEDILKRDRRSVCPKQTAPRVSLTAPLISITAAAKDGNTTSCDVINDCESSAKLKTKSVEISEASGVISRQTTFVTVNQETNEELPNFVQTQSINRGIQKTIFRRCSQRRSGYTAGLGRRLDASFNDTDEDVFLSTGFPDPLSNSSHPIYSGGCPLDEYVDPPSPSPTYLTKGTMFGRHFSFSTSISSTAINNDERSSSLKKKATSLLAGKLSRGRLGSVPSKKPMFKAFIPDRTLSTEMVELISLVDLQMACGAWELNYKLAEAIDIPLESLRRSSPLCYMRPPACTCGQEIQIRVEDLSEEVDSGEERESDDRGSSASTPGTLRRQQRVSEDDAHTAELVDGDIPGQSDDNPDCDLPKTTPKKINAKSRQGSREVPVTQSEKRETIALFPESGMTKRRKFSTSKDSKDSSLSMHNSSQEIPSKRPESYRFGRFSTTDEEFSEFSDVFSPTSPPDFGTPIFRIDDEETNQLWATSLALSWLEYKCSSFFEEWELIAAKADRWLSVQNLPNGFDLPSLKAAAAQVLVLLGRPKLQRQASVGQ